MNKKLFPNIDLIEKAVRENNPELLKNLKKPILNKIIKNNPPLPPLHKAAQLGSLKEVKYLLTQGLDLDAADFGGLTALHHAAEGNFLSIVNFLINQGADVNAEDYFGNTPLLHVAHNPKGQAIIRRLIENGANVDHQNSLGNSALHNAVSFVVYENVKELFKHKINKELINNAGFTAYQELKNKLKKITFTDNQHILKIVGLLN